MPLSIAHFKEVAAQFRTHKESAEEERPEDVLSDEEVARLREKYAAVDEHIVQQAVVVRKRNRKHVEKMLDDLVAFRERNGWKLPLSADQINRAAIESGAHGRATSPEGMPMLVMRCGKVDVDAAPAQDFQKHAAYLLETLTYCNEAAQERGIAVEFDFAGASFGILRRMSGEDLKRGLGIFRAFPVKVKKVYVSNASMPVRLAIKAVLAMASGKVRSKVQFL